MPTPAYTELDRNKPDGSSTPSQYSADDLANVRALADALVLGRAKGWLMSRTQGTGPDVARPQYLIFTNGALILRLNITWTGFNPTTVQYEWSNDTGGSYANVGTAQVNTFDASQNITGSTNSGGVGTWLMEVWAKAIKTSADFIAHINATGTAVHGLGTMSTQNANAIAATGGNVDGTAIGATTTANGDFKRVREEFHDYGTIAAGGTVTLELDKYSAFAFTPNATTSNTVIIAVSGAPASGKYQSYQLEIINGQRSADGKITWPSAAKWIGGSGARPGDNTLEVSGRNIFAFSTRDGATRLEIQHLGKGG